MAREHWRLSWLTQSKGSGRCVKKFEKTKKIKSFSYSGFPLHNIYLMKIWHLRNKNIISYWIVFWTSYRLANLFSKLSLMCGYIVKRRMITKAASYRRLSQETFGCYRNGQLLISNSFLALSLKKKQPILNSFKILSLKSKNRDRSSRKPSNLNANIKRNI